jgi:glycosyltransferase involved in cell wall biosynthesis
MRGLIAVPVYNEADNLQQVIMQLKDNFPLKNLLFINDGSTDGSEQILAKAGLSYLNHPMNLGYNEALRTAMNYTFDKEYDFVVFFDSDGQHRVEDLLKIIQRYETDKYDLIIGSRYQKYNDQPLSLRLIGTKIFSAITTMFAGISVTDVTCGLKLISRRFLPIALKLPAEDMHAEFIVGMARCGAKICEVEITVLPRESGTSMYHFYKGLLYPVKTVLCLLGSIMFYKHLQSELRGENNESAK